MEFFDTSDLRNQELVLKLVKKQEGNIEKQFVPSYLFEICDLEGNRMGQISLRVGHNERLYYGGNIGYGIDEAYRGHRFATKACQLLLELARKHNLEYLIITCAPKNVASYKTIEAVGGRLLEIANVPTWHNMYDEGKRQVKVYRIDL